MHARTTIDKAFVFGPYRLLPGRHLLLKDNSPVKLGGRALDLLHILLARAGTEVSKKELMNYAWSNVFVDEQNLKVHIRSLRRALGDVLPHSRYIATVVGRGYQFVGDVRLEHTTFVEPDGAADEVASMLPRFGRLYGRDEEAKLIGDAVDAGRLVTLTGHGGVGKTSLAVEIAEARASAFPDGVHFVDLSATDDPGMVPHLIASRLRVRGDRGDVVQAIVTWLTGRRALLILDNCEHVLSAASAFMQTYVRTGLRGGLLATSREPLRFIGEEVIRVKSLAYPSTGRVRTAAEALSYPSIELFASRGFEGSEYEFDDHDAAAVARLCEALDGLPLAIEIAAGQLNRFSPAQLLASVSRNLDGLANADDAAHPRHRTVWATLDWSYRLLSGHEAAVFRLLGVFAGEFEWSDVAYIAELVSHDAYQTTMALSGLVAKSLVTAELRQDRLIYRLLESARSYSLEAASAAGLSAAANRRHAELTLSLLRQAEEQWAWTEAAAWRARYEPRIGDLRKALDWCFGDEGEPGMGVEIAIAAIRLWNERSSIGEQLFQVERALEHCTSEPGSLLGKATLAQSRAYSMNLARMPRAETERAWDMALDLAERSGDLTRRLSIMFGKAVFLIYSGRNQQALYLIDRLIALAAEAGDAGSIHDGERLAGLADMHLGRLERARSSLDRLAVDLARGVAPSRTTRYQQERYVSIHTTRAFVTWLMGEYEEARRQTDEIVDSVGSNMGQSNALSLVALPLALLSGDFDGLARYLAILRSNLDQESIRLFEPVHRFYHSALRYVRGDAGPLLDMAAARDELVSDMILMRTPMYSGIFAAALLHADRVDAAGDAIDDALALLDQHDERWFLPELLRIKAAVLRANHEDEEAWRTLGAAFHAAEATGARALTDRIRRSADRWHEIAAGAQEEPHSCRWSTRRPPRS